MRSQGWRNNYDQDDEYPMDRDNYEFLSAISREEPSDLSKAVPDLVTRGRLLPAMELQSKKGVLCRRLGTKQC